MREVRIVDGEVVTLPLAPVRRVVVELCPHCGSDVVVCGERLCRQHRHTHGGIL